MLSMKIFSKFKKYGNRWKFKELNVIDENLRDIGYR